MLNTTVFTINIYTSIIALAVHGVHDVKVVSLVVVNMVNMF